MCAKHVSHCVVASDEMLLKYFQSHKNHKTHLYHAILIFTKDVFGLVLGGIFKIVNQHMHHIMLKHLINFNIKKNNHISKALTYHFPLYQLGDISD